MEMHRIDRAAHAGLLLVTALLVGLTDALTIRLGWFGASGPWKFVPVRIWFVAPLVWLAVVALLAVPAAAISRRWGSRVAAAAAIWIFAAEAASESTQRTFAVVAAVAALALIVALRFARRIMAANWNRVAAGTAAVFVLLAAGAAATTGPLHEDSKAAAGAGARGPNVLVVFLDTVRYDAIFDRGGAVRPELPNFARLAAESTVYGRAYAPSGWTLPSHLSALTGVDAHQLGIDFDQQEYSGDAPTLASKYRRQGYRTVAVVANPYMSTIGHDLGDFDVWDESQNALDVCRTAPGRFLDDHVRRFSMAVCIRGAGEVTSRALEHARRGGAPYFMLLNYMDAHSPYDPTGTCGGRITGSRFSFDPQGYARRYAGDYQRAVSCLDATLGPLLAAARRDPRGTIVVLTADHGEQFGEHGLIVHANSLYPQLLHVPLLVHWPGAKANRVEEVTSLADLPSILQRTASPTPGLAEAALLQREGPGALRIWSVIRGEWQMIVTERGKSSDEQLYDLTIDPRAELNRVDDASVPPGIVARLRNEIAKMKREHVRPRETRFRSLGYLH